MCTLASRRTTELTEGAPLRDERERQARGTSALCGQALCALALALVIATGLSCGGSREVERPGRAPHPGLDVVVIAIDTLRVDHLGFAGYKRDTAPFLGRLAARGALFARAYSTSSWTAPATASLFTGLYPTAHGVVRGLFAHKRARTEVAAAGRARLPLAQLPAASPTLAERYHSEGYATYGAAANINIGPQLGFNRGFDRFYYSTEADADEILGVLDGWRAELLASPRPVFLYLHFNDLHHPYHERAPWFKAKPRPLPRRISAYDSGISYLDARLEQLHASLHWGENTLVVVTSDHGEEFREHGRLGHEGGLYGELQRVLLLFAGPGIPAQRISQNASLVDVLPTLLELSDLPPLPTADGASLASLVRGGPALAAAGDRTLYAHRINDGAVDRPAWAALRGDWKLVLQAGERQLFHLGRDPLDLDDRLAAGDAVPTQLGAALDAFRERGFPPVDPAAGVEIDARTLQLLERLGYAEGAESVESAEGVESAESAEGAEGAESVAPE